MLLSLETTDGLVPGTIPKVNLLRTLPYIRKRCADVMQLARERKLGNFRVEDEKIKEAAMIVKVRVLLVLVQVVMRCSLLLVLLLIVVLMWIANSA